MLFDGIMEEGLQLTAEVLIRAEELSRTLQINKEQMLKNVNLNQGLDNSEFVMMNVAEKIGKDRAHELMYEKAMETELEGKDYYHVLTEDETLASMFTADELKSMIDPANYTGLCSVLAEEMGQKALKRAEKLKRTLEPKENGGDMKAAADQ